MLSKAEIKSCLAGDATPIVPSYLFWFDCKFVDKNAAEVNRMRELHSNDFIQMDLDFEKRAADPELEPGEFTDK